MKHTGFFQSMDRSSAGKPVDRRQWGFGLNAFWVPLMTALNVDGVTAIPEDALGAPIRLRRDKDTGEVRFGTNGRPQTYVAKPVADEIRAEMASYEQRGLEYIGSVQKGKAQEYAAEVAALQKAGEPINTADIRDLTAALAVRTAEEAAHGQQGLKLAEQAA